MIRIRGRIGDWPIDLELTLDAEDWQRLAGAVRAEPVEASPSSAAPVSAPASDALWDAAQDLLREHGELDGPGLLAALRALSGTDQAAKRLLVRLRHCESVVVSQAEGAPHFRWVGAPRSEG